MYRNQCKNSFYEISISTPDAKKSVRLSGNILKMCNSVDIVEAIASEDSEGMSSATITFVEADFLPDRGDKTPIEGVAGHGYITNRTGALIDLRFDTEKGFTYVTSEELQSGLTKSSRTKGGSTEEVKFVFSTNNIIDITWGNLEPKTSRSRRFRIGTVTYSTGSGGNTLTLQCFDLQKDLARVKVDEGLPMVDKTGKPKSLKQALYSIAYVFGARLEFDEAEVTKKDMENYTPPSEYIFDRSTVGGDSKVSTDGTPLYLLRSQSIDYWLKDLARQYNSTYEIYEDPIVGIPVIKFTAKTIRFKKILKTLNYRDPNGVMLEFQYNSLAGELNQDSSSSSVDETGLAESDYKTVQMTDGRNQDTPAKTFESIPLVYSSRAREELQRDLVGTSVTSPSTTKSSVQSQAELQAYKNSFMGFITVRTVGHPDFRPDVYDIQGVGIRASTTYRFFQVQHTLNNSGYTCSMQGKTQEVMEQGIDNKELEGQNQDYRVVQLQTPKGQ